MPTDEVTIVLIHGAGTGAWAWERVQARLPIPSLTVDMPLGEEGATPHRCADIVMAALSDSQTSRLIPVLHSWAGVLSGLLAERLAERVAHIIYLSAVIPPDGGSFADALPIPQRWILRRLYARNPKGLRPSDAMIRREYCNDLDEQDARTVVERFSPQRAEPFLTSVPGPASTLPSTYITLRRDHSVTPRLQERFIRRLSSPARIAVDAGHLAMLSQPDEVASVIGRVAAV